MKKFALVLFCFFALVFLCFCAFVLLSGCMKENTNIQTMPTMTINGQVFQVEVVDTSAKQYQGLSGRESLAQDHGMLFVYNDYRLRHFFMRDMKFPLDILWIKDNRVVACENKVSILTNGQTTHVYSPQAVNYVLEINSGICEQFNIKAGDRVDIKLK